MPHNTAYYWANKEKELSRNAKYHRDNKEKIARRRRNTRHGITQEWFDEKVKSQDNRCAICKKEFVDTPHIDHNHKCCPKLRSCDKCRRDLLCTTCNVLVGMAQESVEVLQFAIQYVLKYKGVFNENCR